MASHASNTTEVGEASVGGASATTTTTTGNTSTETTPMERLPTNSLNTPAAAAAAATAALAAAMGHAQMQQQQQQQQPVVVNQRSAHFGYQQQQQQQIAAAAAAPNVFKNMKLRRGKWTPEEEEYAAFLIQEFEKGTISGCENGCTLRAFLSKKLHCAPMRISKKYAGKSIGKHVFLSRKPTAMVPPQDNTRLKQLEMAFYKSLFSDRESSQSPYSLAPFLPQAAATAARPMPHHHHMQFPPPAPYPAYGHPMAATAAPVVNRAMMPGPAHAMAPVQALPHPPALAQVPPQAPVSSHAAIAPAPVNGAVALHPKPPSDETAVQLHQSYVDALNQMQRNYAAASMPAQPAANPQRPSSNGGSGGVAGSYTGASANGVIPPRPPETRKEEQNVFPAPASGLQDIPDILSGFDKAAANAAKWNQQQNGEALNGQQQAAMVNGQPHELVASQYSPPFTSRSFDDFHQLLGKDLLQLEETKAENSKVRQRKPEFDTDNLTADAYAMFAQESAQAVSQHSAYCRTEAVPSASTTPSVASAPFESQQPSAPASAAVVSVGGDSGNPHIHRHLRPSPNRSSVVNAANLRAHAKAAEQTAIKEEFNSTSESTTNKRPEQSYMRRAGPHVISSSETSDMGTEESESAIGSSRGSGSEDPSDNTSNDSDSNSDDGPCLKKQKTCRQESEREISQNNREAYATTLSLNRASSQGAN